MKFIQHKFNLLVRKSPVNSGDVPITIFFFCLLMYR
jgi:hypothetical protein